MATICRAGKVSIRRRLVRSIQQPLRKHCKPDQFAFQRKGKTLWRSPVLRRPASPSQKIAGGPHVRLQEDRTVASGRAADIAPCPAKAALGHGNQSEGAVCMAFSCSPVWLARVVHSDPARSRAQAGVEARDLLPGWHHTNRAIKLP